MPPLKAGTRDGTRAELGVPAPFRKPAPGTPRLRVGERVGATEGRASARGSSSGWVTAGGAVRGSRLGSSQELGSRVAGRAKNRETSSGRAGPPMEGLHRPPYAVWCPALGLYRHETLGPALKSSVVYVGDLHAKTPPR